MEDAPGCVSFPPHAHKAKMTSHAHGMITSGRNSSFHYPQLLKHVNKYFLNVKLLFSWLAFDSFCVLLGVKLGRA